jgi:hypothetical protein
MVFYTITQKAYKSPVYAATSVMDFFHQCILENSIMIIFLFSRLKELKLATL